MGGNHGQARKISRRLLARRYCELRALVRDRDLRTRWRAGLSAERIPCAYRHRGCNAHLRVDRGFNSAARVAAAPSGQTRVSFRGPEHSEGSPESITTE